MLLVFFVLAAGFAKEMLSFAGGPHHVSMQRWKGNIDDLLEVLVNGVDPLSASRSYPCSKAVED